MFLLVMRFNCYQNVTYFCHRLLLLVDYIFVYSTNNMTLPSKPYL